jgi:hypothetical protein
MRGGASSALDGREWWALRTGKGAGVCACGNSRTGSTKHLKACGLVALVPLGTDGTSLRGQTPVKAELRETHPGSCSLGSAALYGVRPC